MLHYSVSEIAKITDGKLYPTEDYSNQNIVQIVIDSRTFFGGKNALFFALQGPRNNGHHYIKDLIKKGVRTFVVSDKKYITPGGTFIFVNDTTRALQNLAAYHRKRFDYPVIGITGSNGKTIVKEWLFELLSSEFKIARSPKSYNSQIGVPLSVLLMEDHFNMGIFEAGISQPGEMKNLEKIVQPEIGVLTNIGDAHQKNFTSKKQKLREKLQLFQSTKQLVFCADDESINSEIQNFCAKNKIEPINWSLHNKNAFIKFKQHSINGRTKITATLKDKTSIFEVPFTDSSSIENACHCFAASTILAKKPKKILPRFENLSAVAMRLEIKKGINNNLLINDYYNSDLTSVSIALSVLHQQAKKEHMKKLVILSDIQQTGIPENELYRQINQLLIQWQIDEIIGVGSEISANSKSFSVPGKFYSNTETLIRSGPKNQITDSAILIKGARNFAFERISEILQQKAHQTVLEIDLNALTHNLNIFRGLLHQDTKIMVMVKAFSYGSGDVEVARLLQYQNVDYLAVAVADEGIELRKAGIEIPIVVMNPEEHSFQNIIDYMLEPNIYSRQLLNNFEKAVTQTAIQNFPVHLKIDTGMNRLGFKSEVGIEAIINSISQSDTFKIKSVFSHLAASDEPDFDSFSDEQFNRFTKLSKKITDAFPYKIDRHILNSAGIERFPEKQMEMVRLGIGLYGVTSTGLPLENISTFKSTVSQVKILKADETIGYGRKGKVEKESEIAIVPVGYADGLDRKLSNKVGNAFVNKTQVPIIGNICMDMLMLDVTGKNVTPGDSVEFFGSNISITEVAKNAGTIPYEILTGISQRVKRIYLQE